MLQSMEVRPDDFYTVSGYVYGDIRYFRIPDIKPGTLYCKYLRLSLNQLLKNGFTDDLRNVLTELTQLSPSDAFYLFTRKEGGNFFVVTELDNLNVRIQPYLYINGFIVIEARNFIRQLSGGYYGP